jgi:hypothetical protein
MWTCQHAGRNTYQQQQQQQHEVTMLLKQLQVFSEQLDSGPLSEIRSLISSVLLTR